MSKSIRLVLKSLAELPGAIGEVIEKYDQENSCQKKVGYSEASAREAAYRMAEKKGEPFEAYECRWCEKWHIGHPILWTD